MKLTHFYQPKFMITLLALFMIAIVIGSGIYLYQNFYQTFQYFIKDNRVETLETVKSFAVNIEKELYRIVPNRPLTQCRINPNIQSRLEHTLQLFSTPTYQYIYILYLDKKEKLRYLADGSFKIEERGLIGQKFDPVDLKWKEALNTQSSRFVTQKKFTNLWLTLYYPLKGWKDRPYLLVFDISMQAFNRFHKRVESFQNLLRNFLIVIILLFAFALLWLILFYYQRKRVIIDPLTKLYNRHYLHEITPLIDLCFTSVIMVDIDHFKRINDHYGHNIGDEVLKQTAKIIQNLLRSRDKVIRMGGEEFLILIKGTDNKKTLMEILNRIHKFFNIHKIRTEKGEISITLSIGAVMTPCKEMSFDIALEEADKMLYIAKTTGRNRIVIYGEENNRYRSLLFSEIIESLEKGDLNCLFLPIIDINNQSITMYEALAQLHYKNHTYLSEEFIPSILNTSHYKLYVKNMLLQVLTTIREKNISLIFNLNLKVVCNDTIWCMVYEMIQSHKQIANRLIIELHELQPPIRTFDIFNEQLASIKLLGVKIAVKLLGNEFEGIQQVLSLNPDIIKIDRSFIILYWHDRRSRQILKSLVKTFKSFGIFIVVEGVEQQEIAKELKEMGVDAVQGFNFAKPLNENYL